MEELFLPEGVANERLEELLEVQRAISADRLSARVGTVQPAIVDRVSSGRLQGRTAGQADDVDGVTWLETGSGVEPDVEPGTLLEARVIATDDYDIEAEVLRIVRPAPGTRTSTDATVRSGSGTETPRLKSDRRLPVVPIGLDGGFGR
jgi:hypothetical protein